jgi:hypothetical protein
MTIWVYFFIWIVDQSIRVCAGLILHSLYFCANELLHLTSNLLPLRLHPSSSQERFLPRGLAGRKYLQQE